MRVSARRRLAKYLQRVSKHFRISRLTVLAPPGGGGGLGADHNAGMPNPLSSAGIKKEVSVQVRRDSADFKGCWGMGVSGPTPSCSLLFFAQSCKSKQAASRAAPLCTHAGFSVVLLWPVYVRACTRPLHC